MLVNPNYPSAPIEVQDVETAGRNLGLRIHVFNARTESEIEPAFASLAEQKVGGLLVADDPFLQGQRGPPCGSDDLFFAGFRRCRRVDGLNRTEAVKPGWERTECNSIN
jgi:hypothetical protein